MIAITEQLQAIVDKWGKEYEVYRHNQHYFVRGMVHYYPSDSSGPRTYSIILLIYSLKEMQVLTNERFEEEFAAKIITEAFK